MTILKRKILVTVFILLFLILAPIIVFYANGNILSNSWNILATGGIFIRSMESGSDLYINGKFKDTVSFFTRDYLLKNLKPGVYTVSAKKDGYNEWTNEIRVYPSRVSESYSFMLPIKIDITEIKEFLNPGVDASTTGKINPKENSDYKIVSDLFSDLLTLESDVAILSTSTGKIVELPLGTRENPVKNRRLTAWRDSQDIFIGWEGDIDSAPQIFCEENNREIECQNQLRVYSFESAVGRLDFFPGETAILVAAVGNRIYAIEAQINPHKKPIIIFEGEAPDFRVLNNKIYIKDIDFLGRVEI